MSLEIATATTFLELKENRLHDAVERVISPDEDFRMTDVISNVVLSNFFLRRIAGGLKQAAAQIWKWILCWVRLNQMWLLQLQRP